MPDAVFVDASAWVALFWPGDKNHATAALLWSVMAPQEWAVITTNWTLYEAATLLNGRYRRHDLAVKLLQLDIEAYNVVKADELEEEALRIFESQADKTWSVVDCANFAAIRQQKCRYVLAFDDHFRQAASEFGFQVLA